MGASQRQPLVSTLGDGSDGTSTLHDIGYLKRGYEDIPGKLGALGINVEELDAPDA